MGTIPIMNIEYYLRSGMMKRGLLIILAVLCAALLYAGDVAAFDDIGFSADGKTYVFGQYGITDKTFQGYAELYAVDIDSNEFVPSGIYRTQASSATAGKGGREVYDALVEKNAAWLSKWNAAPAGIMNTLFMRTDEAKNVTAPIVVNDYEHSEEGNLCSYTFTLVPFVQGSGDAAVSSFYINVEKKDADGNQILKFVAGSPDVKRKGVSGYAIDKIMCDDAGSRFVIVVEKISDEGTAPSVRYMVETFKLN